MLLQLPHELHYPIHITAVLKQPNDEIKKYTPLVRYKFRTLVDEDDEFTGEPRKVEKWYPATWDSPVEGVLKRWMIREGSIVTSGNVDLVEIEEPCPHDVQFGGMCAGCGMDMTLQDYMSFSNRSRADISMAHDNLAVLVSQDEAARLEAEAEQRLLESRKLSLVVDLDQTIIHATVDPTVAQWQANPSEVNHEVLKDVQSFSLPDPGYVPEGQKPHETWYYVKLRPGLRQFLENISKLYELHIYTMGTRAYALNVAKIVDPDGKIFGSRVLSRDESGSMTEKDLRRLFPKNTKMVVIIDDRGDVWKWSDNLIRVKPYDFFVGIGDINSSFLPKKQEFPTGPSPTAADEASEAVKPVTEEKLDMLEDLPSGETVAGTTTPAPADLTTLEQLVKMGASDDKLLLEEQAHQLSDAIRTQQETRPLAKQQHLLDLQDEAEAAVVENGETGSTTPSEHGGVKHRHQLIKDEYPRELEPLERNLTEVHRVFFKEFDESMRRNGSWGTRADIVPDVKVLMPRMKRKTLDGVTLVFSGVIPLGASVPNSDIAIWARSFGARIEENLTARVTHVVAARSRTAKVREAARYPHIHIVTPQWLYDSLSNWRRMPLEPYLIAIHPEDRNPPGAPLPELADSLNLPMSSDEDDEDDEDEGVLVDEEMEIENDAAEVLKEGLTVDREDIYRELEEFLRDTDDDGEDDDDTDLNIGDDGDEGGSRTLQNGDGGISDTESVASTASTRRPKRRKHAQNIPRKRSRTSTLDVDGVDSDTRHNAGAERSFSSTTSIDESDDDKNWSSSTSRLAKRQKLARERHTGLRTVVTPTSLEAEHEEGKEAMKEEDKKRQKLPEGSENNNSGIPSPAASTKDDDGVENIPKSLTTSMVVGSTPDASGESKAEGGIDDGEGTGDAAAGDGGDGDSFYEELDEEAFAAALEEELES